MIRFSCPTCGKVLKAPDNWAGRKFSCPKCGQVLLVPSAARQADERTRDVPPPPLPYRAVPLDESKIYTPTVAPPPPRTAPQKHAAEGVPVGDCPNCHASLHVPSQLLGRQVECPKCGMRFTATALTHPVPVLPEQDEGNLPARKRADEKYCHECGATIRAKAEICPKCGVRQPSVQPPALGDEYEQVPSTNRVSAGILGILLGALGIHKFVLGYSTAGIIMLLVTILTCGWGGIAMGIIGMVEGIIYLTKSEREFYQTYVVRKKDWF